jgi:hypothetical protein
VRAKLPQKAEPVNQGHPQVEDDRVGALLLGLDQAFLGADSSADLVSLEAEHPREGLRHSLVVVHDEDFRGRLF